MAEAFVYGVLKQLGSLAVQPIQEELKLVVCLNKEVTKLTREFEIIQAVLVDAEQRQFTEKSVRVWLERLNDVSYDVDHVLDKWRTVNLQIDGEADQHADTFMSKVCSRFLFPYLVIRVRRVALAINLSFKIKAINERLDDIAKEKDKYGFRISTPATAINELPQLEETTSDASEVFGLVEYKNALVGELLHESCEEKLRVISIIGMGGLGKSTLARFVYNSEEVIGFFDKRIWVFVSNPFDKLRIARNILKLLEDPASESDSSPLEFYFQKISESLKEKKFLIVLDNVWTDDPNDWEQLHNCLKKGLHGSKVLVTTRNQSTADMMESIYSIPIEELPEEYCLSLFRRFAFPDGECTQPEAIIREIVSKCKGLPLAIKAMGCLLRGKRKIDEWERILHSEMWKLVKLEKDVSTPLLVSYYNLPSMVKRCFTYCAMFSKGFIFEKDEFIKLLMAQGYLKLDHNEELEIIGEEYFNCLAMRSFFQEFKKDNDGRIIWCKMHDRVHDVAQYLSNNECCMIDVKDFTKQRMNALCEKARHLRLIVTGSDTFPISICNFKKLRSLLIEVDYVGRELIGTVLPKLFDELTGLKALGISEAYIEHIPKKIGKLIHLRYLDLSKNRGLIKLPETLCELYNLQTLKLDWCKNLKELPQGIGKLINLRHLMNWGTNSLMYMPKGMERLIHLRTLTEFHLNSGDYGGKTCSFEFLNNIESLRIKRLKILAKVTDEIVQLKNIKKIRDLVLSFCGSGPTNNDDEAILEAFQPPPNLEELTIYEYKGPTMSTLTSLTNLRSINLDRCRECLHMPPLGKLPSLETLVIVGMVRVREVGNEFLGVESGEASSSSSSIIYFPNLKTLRFGWMEEWEVWDFGNESDTCTIMPSLRSLGLYYCDKLKGLPKQLLHQKASLQNFSIYYCRILEEVYSKGKGDKWQDISHIPNIFILYSRSRRSIQLSRGSNRNLVSNCSNSGIHTPFKPET